MQAPHTRGGGTPAPSTRPVISAGAGDNNSHCVLIILVLAGAGAGPPGHSDALAVVGDDHVARFAARAVCGLELYITARNAATAAQGQADVYERGGYTAVRQVVSHVIMSNV